MKIMATCLNCGRDFLLDQLIEGPVITGKCPWCEELLAPNYTVLLPEVIRQAEARGSELSSALRMLNGSWARFRIKPESVLEPLQGELAPAEEEHRGQDRLRKRVRQEIESLDTQLSAGTAGAAIADVERELRDAAAAAEARDRGAAQEVASATEALAASADAAGAAAGQLRDEIARLSGADRSRLSAAAEGLAQAADAARTAADDRAREPLERLRNALREAEEALAELGATA